MNRPTVRRVTWFMVEEELDSIEGEIEPRIQILEFPVPDLYEEKGVMAFEAELDVVDVDLPGTVDTINNALSYFPEVDWRAFLRRLVDQVLVHRNQAKYLSKRGISLEQQEEPHYRYLREFHAQHAVPRPVWRRVFLRELQKVTAGKMEEVLEIPEVWSASSGVLSEEDIREIFGPYGVAEAMLKMKDIADKVRTKEDIIRYAPVTKKLLGFLEGFREIDEKMRR